jgi:lactam utilization protein B
MSDLVILSVVVVFCMRRVAMLCAHGEIESIAGRRLRICADTICLHSDHPRSVALAGAVARALKRGKHQAPTSVS